MTANHSHHAHGHDHPAHHHHSHAGHAPPAEAVTSVPAAPAGKVEYTCPMHPQIVRDAPGSCPICGMTLEPRVPTLEAGPDPELRDMTRRFWISAAFTLPLLVVAMSEMVGVTLVSGRTRVWLELVLALPVCTWGRGRFTYGSCSPSGTAASTCSR
jgi:cation transport ATPase